MTDMPKEIWVYKQGDGVFEANDWKSSIIKETKYIRADCVDQWMPIETAPKNKCILIYYKNGCGKGRVVKAFYAVKFSLESHEDYAEYDEKTDCYYAQEGWYEDIDNWDEFSSVAVSQGEPTHWMPLPMPPEGAK